MSVPQIPDPAGLVMSVLASVRDRVEAATAMLVRRIGPVEKVVGPFAFDFTSYYDSEMGPGIQRWLWLFSHLVDRGELARIKLVTNEIESSFLVEGKRTFNLDPGLLTLENFVLATGKNRAHRIYLGDGIFADLTLVFREGTYRPLPWTYPDYADPELIMMLNELRESYKCKLRQAEGKAIQLRA
ncbi:MAG: DUF4416 family protein [Deltaproteobacteria bacterium]